MVTGLGVEAEEIRAELGRRGWSVADEKAVPEVVDLVVLVCAPDSDGSAELSRAMLSAGALVEPLETERPGGRRRALLSVTKVDGRSGYEVIVYSCSG